MSDIIEESKHRISDKIKKDPTPVIGLTGLAAAVGYSIYHFRKRDKSIPPSVYVIQTRVIAQGIVVGTLTLSLIYRMYKNLNKPKIPTIPDETINIVTPSEIKKIEKT